MSRSPFVHFQPLLFFIRNDGQLSCIRPAPGESAWHVLRPWNYWVLSRRRSTNSCPCSAKRTVARDLGTRGWSVAPLTDAKTYHFVLDALCDGLVPTDLQMMFKHMHQYGKLCRMDSVLLVGVERAMGVVLDCFDCAASTVWDAIWCEYLSVLLDEYDELITLFKDQPLCSRHIFRRLPFQVLVIPVGPNHVILLTFCSFWKNEHYYKWFSTVFRWKRFWKSARLTFECFLGPSSTKFPYFDLATLLDGILKFSNFISFWVITFPAA